MAKRRGNNEGSLYKRKDGLWCAQVSLDGRRLTKYSRSATECREWIKETLTRIEGGLTFEATKVTLEQFFDVWLRGKQLSRRQNTVQQYEETTRLHILPVLGRMRLRDIQAAHIMQFYDLKRREGRGARTIQLIHTILHNIFKQALRQRILGYNPVEAVERPKVEQAEMKLLNEKQIQQFLIAATGSTFEAAYYLALTTGMREGELLGLKWADIDWNRSILFVQRQLQQVKGQGYVFIPPKTRAGRREIKVGAVSLRYLEAHRDRQSIQKSLAGERWQEKDLIFPTTIGTPLDCRRLTDEFKLILKRARLPKVRFHDLRHSSINALLDNEIPVNTVQRRAGHSKASTTVNIYGHSTAHSQDNAAEKIEQLITPIPFKMQ